MKEKDDRIDLSDDYRCSSCGILLSSKFAGNDNGTYCEECIERNLQ